MPSSRIAKQFTNLPLPSSRRIRAAALRSLGAASTVLRLTQPTPKRLPTPLDLSDWMHEASSVMLPVTGPLSDLRFNSPISRF